MMSIIFSVAIAFFYTSTQSRFAFVQLNACKLKILAFKSLKNRFAFVHFYRRVEEVKGDPLYSAPTRRRYAFLRLCEFSNLTSLKLIFHTPTKIKFAFI